MPIFEFMCAKCNCQFEKLVFADDDVTIECPTCCGQDVKKLMSAGTFRPNGIPTGAGGFTPPKCKPSGGG